MLEMVDDPLGLQRGVPALVLKPSDCLQDMLAPFAWKLAEQSTMSYSKVPVQAVEVSPLRHDFRFNCTFSDHCLSQ